MATLFEARFNPDDTPYTGSRLVAALEDREVLVSSITDRLDGELIARLPQSVRLIAQVGNGFDNLDIEAAYAAGLTVTNTPSVLTEDTADMALLLMLALPRRLVEGAGVLPEGGTWPGWSPTWMLGRRLRGKTLGIVGMGRIGTAVAAAMVIALPDTSTEHASSRSPMLRLPYFTREGSWYGGAILLCWATTGLVISVLPSVLARHGLSKYSGLSAMLAISCGLLFQPWARRLDPTRSTRLGILVLLPAYALLAWGAWSGSLTGVLIGSFLVSSACYGFVYLGGLAGAVSAGGSEKTRASAAFFLMAYIGFSIPVIFTGMVADRFGATTALVSFGVLLLFGAVLLLLPRASSLSKLSARTA